MRRLTVYLIAFLMLAACGTAPQTTEQPTSAPQIVTQVVVVTATIPPATATPAATLTATPKPTVTPAPTRTPIPTPVTGKWKVETEKSSFDDSTTVFLSVDAESTIEGPLGPKRPTLFLRCKEKETEVFIVTEMQPDVEGLDDKATVRLRLDKEKAITVKAGKSTSGDALFIPQPKAFTDTLLNYQQLVAGFTPFGAAPAEMTFDLRGLSEAIKPLREACP